jgi:hypothetical protein
MSRNVADFPGAVWDGLSDNRLTLDTDKRPDFEDWDQVTAEMIALQTEVYKQKFITLANASGGALVPGAPVYNLADASGVGKADCNGTTVVRQCIGLVKTGSASLAATLINKQGPMTLTTAEWDTAAGTTGGLTAGTEYYVSGTAGVITATRPSTTGDNITSVGIALSTTVLNVNIKHIGVSA